MPEDDDYDSETSSDDEDAHKLTDKAENKFK